MAVTILSGKEISAGVRGELKARVEVLKQQGVTPVLIMVRVGEDPASVSYMRQKEKTAAEVGVESETVVFPEDTPEATLLAKIDELNRDPAVHGILVQLPLPRHIDPRKVIEAIDPKKDVNCFHPVNVGKLLLGQPYLLPCTPHGVQQILLRSGYSPEGKHVVICGRSNINGKPLFAILIQKQAGANATVTVCHQMTRSVAMHSRRADVVVVAVGIPKFFGPDMVKPGAAVIDIGINQQELPNGRVRIVGDVDTDQVKEIASWITPVPGGVGPVTVGILMRNATIAHQRQIEAGWLAA